MTTLPRLQSGKGKKIGHIIAHHFHRHRKSLANHVVKHHKKYIWGLGVASGIATFKMFVLIFGIGFGLNPQNAYGQMDVELNYAEPQQTTSDNFKSYLTTLHPQVQ